MIFYTRGDRLYAREGARIESVPFSPESSMVSMPGMVARTILTGRFSEDTVRHNKFGDTYCHNGSEVLDQLNQADCDVGDVYLSQIDPPSDTASMWCGEINENGSGDLVCYVESDTEESLIAMVKELKIEVMI